ncbi:MAG TPA: HAMP domain-containing sensor histidine kinase [Labilithrix sp.]
MAQAKKKPSRDPLLASICHDLRAPLAAVTMGANFVLQTTPDASVRQKRILEAMLRSCSQMERLVRNFADLAEIEGEGVSLRIGVHDVGEMLEIAKSAAEPAASDRHVHVDVDKPKSRLALECDRDRLLRALGHLLENAVKFAPDGSAVELSASKRGGNVVFEVVDFGPGLERDVLENLFDRQWLAKRAKRVGAGFGLAIARGFAAAHGGRVEIESTPGSRTTARIIVPASG